MPINERVIEKKRRFENLKKSFDIRNQSSPEGNTRFFTCEEPNQEITIPLYSSRVSAGFATVVDDHIEQLLDLNKHLIKRPASTFLVRVEGDSMTGAGIFNHDILIVDRSLKATDGKIVVAVIDNEFTVKRLRLAGKQVTLLPENPDFKPTVITEDMDFKIWGVVLHGIRTF